MVGVRRCSMRRKLEMLVKVGLIFLFLWGVVSLSRVIVSGSYSSLEVLVSKGKENISSSSSEESADVLEKVFTSDDKFSTVSLLYNPNNLEERRNVFLENNYPELLKTDLLSKIKESASDEFSGIFAPDNTIDGIYTIMSDTGELSEELLKEKVDVLIRQDLCIVDFFNETSVVYEYIANPSILVCVDYSQTLFNRESRGIMNLGDTGSVYLTKDSYSIKNIEGYTVIYAKG